MGKRGFKPKPISTELLYRLAAIQCTQKEMAAVVGLSEGQLSKRLKADQRLKKAIEMGQEYGKTALRRKQFQVAMSGNVAMLIWLGKQMLGQADKQELFGKGGKKLVFTLDVNGNGGDSNGDNESDSKDTA